MKILVTGSEGFIGSHLTELLVEKGYKVNARGSCIPQDGMNLFKKVI